MIKNISVKLSIDEARKAIGTYMLKEDTTLTNIDVDIVSSPLVPSDSYEFNLNQPVPQSVLHFVKANPKNRMGTVREIRAYFGWGLKDAKDYMEHIWPFVPTDYVPQTSIIQH